jgi:tetratricopeptide (TPR) repeat protein
LFQLGAVYVAMEDWGRADGVITALESQNNPESSARATELTARKLAGQKRDEDLKAMLENMANDPSSGRNVQIALLQSKLQDEGPDAAMEYLDGLLAEAPSDPALRFVKAGLVAANGQFDVAEADFRALVAEDNQRAPVWLALYRLKLQQGDQAAASAVLTDAIAAMPEEGNLLWARAGELERSGDLQGAIGIYEQMYARNSNSLIVANNLASLLTVASDDPETLQRAYTIARRLRESEIPAFQDTYGWIAFRRGDLEEALQYLEPAAAGLTGDPRVQFHLATTYAALGRNADALAQFRKVSEMIDTSNPPEFAAEVQSEITRLETAPVQD